MADCLERDLERLHVEQPAALPAREVTESAEADDEEAAGEEHRRARYKEKEARHLQRGWRGSGCYG